MTHRKPKKIDLAGVPKDTTKIDLATANGAGVDIADLDGATVKRSKIDGATVQRESPQEAHGEPPATNTAPEDNQEALLPQQDVEIVGRPEGTPDHGYIAIHTLTPHPRNYNQHPPRQIEKLRHSLRRFGQARSIVAWRGYILAGTGIWEAAKAEGFTSIRADILDPELDELHAQSYLAADNELARQADPDELQLYALVIEAQKASAELALAMGFNPDDIALLTRHVQNHIAPEDTPDVAPTMEKAQSLQREWGTEAGQIWALGRHRLAIGDCRDQALVDQLVEGWPIDALITDPPYGVDYAGKAAHLNTFRKGPTYAGIENDNTDQIGDYRLFFAEFLKVAPLNYHNTIFIFMAGQRLHELRLAFEDAAATWGDYLIWIKHAPVIGRKDHHAQHEFIVYGWRNRHRFYGRYPSTIYDDQKPIGSMTKEELKQTLEAIYAGTNILRFDRPMRHSRHPTEKSVDLIEELIIEGSAPEHRIYDPFVGSGTVYIAAQRRDRTAYGVELLPAYAAVAIQRFKESTGIEPARIIKA